MKENLLRLIALFVVFIGSLIAFSCANDETASNSPKSARGARSLPIAVDKAGDRALIPPRTFEAKYLGAFKDALGMDQSLYKVRISKGTKTDTIGKLSENDLSTGLIKLAIISQNAAMPGGPPEGMYGVTIQAGRGRGGATTMNPNKKDVELVNRMKQFFQEHR